jgi:hypothetical protein
MSAAGDNLALRGVSRMAISQGEDEAKYKHARHSRLHRSRVIRAGD